MRAEIHIVKEEIYKEKHMKTVTTEVDDQND